MYSEIEENQQDEFGEGVRLSELQPEHFARYLQRWITYWPKKADPGFNVKYGYDTGFVYKQNKEGRRLPLFGDYLIQQVERHLSPLQWEEWRERQGKPVAPRFQQSDFWLGLHMPNSTTVTCIDIDAKQFLLGYYRRRANAPLRPVVTITPDHLKVVKAIYQKFPGRNWCLSSETLGLHAWTKFTTPVVTSHVNRNTKHNLAQVNLSRLEVHPMPGRCLRRPFGTDYRTITDQGLLDNWWEQTDYFETFTPDMAPNFTTIARTLLDASERQLQELLTCGDALRKANFFNGIAQHREQLAKAKKWIDNGYEDDRSVGATITSSSPALIRCVSSLTPAKPDVAYDLDRLRHGNWPKELERLAIEGLPCAKSLGLVCHEMAKWLIWVEMYHETDKHERAYTLLCNYANMKHNGHCYRLLNGREMEVYRQIKAFVALATKNIPPSSLELFALLRQKRSQGRYSRIIDIAPILAGSAAAVTSTSSSPALFICIKFG